MPRQETTAFPEDRHMAKKIVLYSTPICPKCQVLKGALPEGITVVDMREPAALTHLRINGVFARSAPVLQVGIDFYTEPDLFKNGNIDTEKLRSILEA